MHASKSPGPSCNDEVTATPSLDDARTQNSKFRLEKKEKKKEKKKSLKLLYLLLSLKIMHERCIVARYSNTSSFLPSDSSITLFISVARPRGCSYVAERAVTNSARSPKSDTFSRVKNRINALPLGSSSGSPTPVASNDSLSPFLRFFQFEKTNYDIPSVCSSIPSFLSSSSKLSLDLSARIHCYY